MNPNDTRPPAGSRWKYIPDGDVGTIEHHEDGIRWRLVRSSGETPMTWNTSDVAYMERSSCYERLPDDTRPPAVADVALPAEAPTPEPLDRAAAMLRTLREAAQGVLTGAEATATKARAEIARLDAALAALQPSHDPKADPKPGDTWRNINGEVLRWQENGRGRWAFTEGVFWSDAPGHLPKDTLRRRTDLREYLGVLSWAEAVAAGRPS